jgi:hypothetical protein
MNVGSERDWSFRAVPSPGVNHRACTRRQASSSVAEPASTPWSGLAGIRNERTPSAASSVFTIRARSSATEVFAVEVAWEPGLLGGEGGEDGGGGAPPPLDLW